MTNALFLGVYPRRTNSMLDHMISTVRGVFGR